MGSIRYDMKHPYIFLDFRAVGHANSESNLLLDGGFMCRCVLCMGGDGNALETALRNDTPPTIHKLK